VTPTLLVNGQANDQHLPLSHPPVMPQPPPHQTPTSQTPAISTASTAHTTTSSFFGPPTEGTQITDFGDEGFLTPKTSPRVRSRNAGVGAAAAGTEDLKRALVASLLRAEISGRAKRLRGTEAKELADAILRKLNATGYGQAEELHRFLCASWLGISSPAGALAQKKITVRRFRVGGDGYDSPLEDEDTLHDGDEIRETFDVEWSHSLGGIEGKFAVKGVALSPGIEDVEMQDDDASDENWQGKYLKAEERRRVQEEELERLRARVLDALV
jgi:hypothetical protein